MSKVIIDNRENNQQIIRELVKQNIDIEKKQLVSADFIIQSKTADNKIIEVGVERKSNNDFLNSIIDKRIIQQLIVLKENFSFPLLIIEGSENIYKIRNFHPNAIRGMLTTIAIDFQIPIIYTKSYRDTASFLSIIAKRLENPRRAISLLKKRKPLTIKEQQEYIIESFPGIGPTLSKSLLKQFNTIKNIINATEEELVKIEKIGPKKTKKIKEVIDKNYNG